MVRNCAMTGRGFAPVMAEAVVMKIFICHFPQFGQAGPPALCRYEYPAGAPDTTTSVIVRLPGPRHTPYGHVQAILAAARAGKLVRLADRPTR
jgi:hypothetical protein